MNRRAQFAMWAAVVALAVYVAPHAIEHVRTSPAFDPPLAQNVAARPLPHQGAAP